MPDVTVDPDLPRRVLRSEGRAILALADSLDESFTDAAELLFACEGKIVLTGIGKAGLIARKISATFCSTGAESVFLHPVEALHGDLGVLKRDEVVVACSHSGSTPEIVRLLDHVKARGARLVAVTGEADSPLARYAESTLCYGTVEEACPLGLAPSVSTACMLALGDALALTVMQMRSFTPEEFAAFHPAGALGRTLLLRAEQAMSFRKGDRLSIVSQDLPLREALARAEQVERRAGAMLLTDGDGKLAGILTDADLRRALLDRGGAVLEVPAVELMIREPKRIGAGELASEALAIMNEYRIDELPVVDDGDRPVGLLDVQDLVGIKTLSP